MRAAVIALALVTLTISAAVPARAQGAAGTTAAGHQRPRWSRSRPASNLDATFRRLVAAQSEPAWIGYTVPTVDRQRQGRSLLQRRHLDFRRHRLHQRPHRDVRPRAGDRTARTVAGPAGARTQSPIRLEGPETMVVLYRVEEKAVQRIRIFSPDCELDAGGAIQWLEACATR